MEEALQLDPDNRSVLDEYFDILRNISMRPLGLFTARLPGIANPIYLRANTSDILNFGQIFLNDEYGFEFLVEPRRILDLGGYAGYAALYLNRRFPQAEIVSVEPSVDNYGMLRLNTVNVTRISAVNGAIWNVPGFVGRSGLEDEHWGHRISVIDDSNKQSRSIEAFTVPQILGRYGWKTADYVKCDIEGAEVELLDQSSNLSWLHGVNVFSIETHDRFRDNSTTTVLAAFPEDKFHRSQSGEFLVFSRKDVTTPDNLPDIIRISPRGSKSLSFERKNVNGAHWGFMAINDQKFQLHPNEPGEPPASIHFEISLSGHSRICARISLESDKAQPVVFKIILKTDQKTILNSEQVVYASGVREIEYQIGKEEGKVTLCLSTEMMPGTNSNAQAWARWENIVFD